MDDKELSWLDAAFLTSVLEDGNDQEHQLTVEKFSVQPAVAAGNNYTSYVYRVFVEYRVDQSDTIDNKSLIVKIPLQKGVMQEMSEQIDFYAKEPKMYCNLLPKMNEMSNVKFGPTSFYCPVKNGMVIQDLSPEGYIMSDRLKQLDFEHCSLVMEKLGKFHASSVACHRDNPEMVENIGKETIYMHGGAMEEDMKLLLSSKMKMFINVLHEIELDPTYLDLITARFEGLWDSIVCICQPQADSLNVLNHGDCWSSNMLFKYDETGCVSDVIFVDFQMTRFSSPITDLLYFVFTSASEEVRESRLQDLFDSYCETLNTTLGQLGSDKRLTNEEFVEQLKLGSDFALVTIGWVLPFIKCETENIVDVENFSTEDFISSDKDSRFLEIYKSEQYRALLPALVKQFITLHFHE